MGSTTDSTSSPSTTDSTTDGAVEATSFSSTTDSTTDSGASSTAPFVGLEMTSPCDEGVRINANGYWCVQVYPNSFYLKYSCDETGSFTAFACPNDCVTNCLADPIT